MEAREKSTEWALLFPLKAGLFAMKSSLSSKSVNREKERIAKKNQSLKSGIRRGSSLSELDKLQSKPVLPDVVRSTEKCSESLPHSPALSRTNLQSGNLYVRGSIGDLMNMKRYGASTWSVRSESLIAKAVPLSTVTPRHSPPVERSMEDDETQDEFHVSGKPLTCAQRTQRLSKLIKEHRRVMVFSPRSLNQDLVSTSVLLIPSKDASIGRAKFSVAGEFHYQHDALPLITMTDKQSQQGRGLDGYEKIDPLGIQRGMELWGSSESTGYEDMTLLLSSGGRCTGD
ncbi:hypothetical protein WN51_11107 [Melipona quadrifasciata]|uniref:Uncharacterized protein n=1 Tax=Melipona quadrifasciata TaxID=166423 RepID=A0A0M9A3Y6_9HYME|nr:hypothetical protein WN51_11107 [Melipona quadrifasciata]